MMSYKLLALIFTLTLIQAAASLFRQTTVAIKTIGKYPALQATVDNTSCPILSIRGGMKGSVMKRFLHNAWTLFRKHLIGRAVPTRICVREKLVSPSRKKSSKLNGLSRIQREMKSFMSNPPLGCSLAVGKDIRSWVVTLVGQPGTPFANESYKLKMTFPVDYPSKPPSVYFLKPCPKHMHVYSNGDICLNLLGRDWRPTMTAELLAVSILSMLCSAKDKAIPQDNALHADSKPGQQQDNWMYHDDRC